MFSERKVLVTGGAGFIGSHLVERLIGLGAHVTSLDHAPVAGSANLARVEGKVRTLEFDLVHADTAGLFADEAFDFVFHLAAGAQVEASMQNPRRDLERNALATLNLLEGLRSAGATSPIVYTSSAVVYRGGDDKAISEDDPTGPTTPYGVSKLAAERYVSIYARLFGLKSAILRLFSVYGPRLRKQVVFDLIGRLDADRDRLTLYGDGAQKRDFSYVDDVVNALILVAERAPLEGEAYNVASGTLVSTLQLAETIAAEMGAKPEIGFSGSAHSGDTRFWIADTTRLQSLGYAPSTSLRDGIKKTVEWFRSEAGAQGASPDRPALGG